MSSISNRWSGGNSEPSGPAWDGEHALNCNDVNDSIVEHADREAANVKLNFSFKC